MKEFLRMILKLILSIPIRICNKINKKFVYTYLKLNCELSEKYVDRYLSINIRPKKEEDRVYYNFNKSNLPPTAIIIQGPICKKDNFTIETLKLYRRMMPNVILIFSTWDTISEEDVKKIKEIENIEIILSKLPEHSGIGNINYQLKSTIAGLEFARSKNVEYVMKTRSDQRFEKNNFLEYFLVLQNSFPIGEEFSYLKQKERIIVGQGSFEGVMFIPYFISDFFYFGRIEDICKMFDFEFQLINQSNEERNKEFEQNRLRKKTFEHYEGRAPEIMIIENYISQNGNRKIQKDVKSYWNFVKNNLITVSNSEIQFFWGKYEKHYLENNINFNFLEKDNEKKFATYTWNFSNWLLLYSGQLKYDENCEKIANQLLDLY